MTKLRVLVRSDRLLTVTLIGSDLNLKHQTVHDILTEELGMRTPGCCITTTLHVTLTFPWTKFWPESVFQWLRSPHTRLSRVRVTSSFSRNSNSTLKIVILELQTTYKRSWQTSTTTGCGNNFSGGVWLPKGTTLKGMMLIFNSVVNQKFYSTSRINF
jgi:hypothetical protein